MGKDLNIYPKSLTVKVKDGILWTSVPDIPGKFFLKFLKAITLQTLIFWKDIQENSILRLSKWKKIQMNKKTKVELLELPLGLELNLPTIFNTWNKIDFII